jgi:ferredoxin
MRALYDVSVNGELFSAAHGDGLLEAALRNGLDIPHDCRSEKCGTCRVRIMDGELEGVPATISWRLSRRRDADVVGCRRGHQSRVP